MKHISLFSRLFFLFVSAEGTEIVLLERALLVLPTEVWVAEVDAGGNRPEQNFNVAIFS